MLPIGFVLQKTIAELKIAFGVADENTLLK